MKRGEQGRGRKSSPKHSLSLPDLDQARSAVLDSLPSKESQRGCRHAAPVAQYAPNGYGLNDMAGNVWQWTSGWYRPDYYQELATAGGVTRNPRGPDSSYDPSEPRATERSTAADRSYARISTARGFSSARAGRAKPAPEETTLASGV